jgi:ketosteroid isomerase-like protein
MGARPSATEAVVRNHLQAFLEQAGIDAILSDYDDDARFLSESGTYHGKREIGGFFEAFIASLPPGAIERFSLRSLRVEGELAYITWSVGGYALLGTDTFVVRNGRIVSQTFAMHLAAAA